MLFDKRMIERRLLINKIRASSISISAFMMPLSSEASPPILPVVVVAQRRRLTGEHLFRALREAKALKPLSFSGLMEIILAPRLATSRKVVSMRGWLVRGYARYKSPDRSGQSPQVQRFLFQGQWPALTLRWSVRGTCLSNQEVAAAIFAGKQLIQERCFI